MDNEKFIKTIKFLIAGKNKIIHSYFDLKVVIAEEIPQLLITTTDNPDELEILALHLGFLTEPVEEHRLRLDLIIDDVTNDNSESRKTIKHEVARVINELNKHIINKLKHKGEN